MSEGNCRGGSSSPASTNPSTSNQVRINPSAVPTEAGVGIEGIIFQGGVDFGLVQGLGRVGAAVSPSTFNIGYSIYRDETQLDDSIIGGTSMPVTRYQVATYNGGISLNSLLLDYSVLRMETLDTHDVSTVRLITASLIWQKVIVTAS